jgi:hypothetical protein
VSLLTRPLRVFQGLTCRLGGGVILGLEAIVCGLAGPGQGEVRRLDDGRAALRRSDPGCGHGWLRAAVFLTAAFDRRVRPTASRLARRVVLA